jgi:hypothetical protein
LEKRADGLAMSVTKSAVEVKVQPGGVQYKFAWTVKLWRGIAQQLQHLIIISSSSDTTGGRTSAARDHRPPPPDASMRCFTHNALICSSSVNTPSHQSFVYDTIQYTSNSVSVPHYTTTRSICSLRSRVHYARVASDTSTLQHGARQVRGLAKCPS